MHNAGMLKLIRKLVPRKLQTLIRFYQIYNNVYGHSNFKNGLIYDGNNRPQPWLTYPCIEFIQRLDLSDCNVFEYGAGSSTFFWSGKVRMVTSVEREREWYLTIKNQLPDNCRLYHCEIDSQYVEQIHRCNGKFDIIVIDGAVRYPCAEAALSAITERGFIILDNTEWYPNTAKLLVNNGYTQVDFSGFPPINAFPSTTSLFYRSPELLNRIKDEYGWRPMGGRFLVAYDDKEFDRIDRQFIRES